MLFFFFSEQILSHPSKYLLSFQMYTNPTEIKYILNSVFINSIL